MPDASLQKMADTYRKRYHDAIRNQRKTHWQEFVAEADNIWNVAKYLQPSPNSAFARIPLLKLHGQQHTSNTSIASCLLKEFFPQPANVEDAPDGAARVEELLMEPLAEVEVRRAVFAAQPYKAPGPDGMPAIVWQELWPLLKDHIVALFRLSLETARIPQAWRVAKIVPLRKPNKPDYTLAKAYRPISLLATLGKNLEAVVAARLSYLAETHHLLPKSHFGARKGRSTTQALTLLQESVYQAWRDRRVLSLVSFDVKGAYNGVNVDVLAKKLQQRRIPAALVTWIVDFCQRRQASVLVNGHTTETAGLPYAGLPQGSPLSPILFLYFNADLVSSKIDRNKGAIAFVDDYTAWVTGPSAEQNAKLLQSTVVGRAERWAASSGATFEADKTAFIHFTRAASKWSEDPLVVKENEVHPQREVKILGVVLDHELRFQQHAARAAKRGVAAALALKRIKGMTAKVARQLFTATVAPTCDYASPIWSNKVTTRARRMLEQVHRIGVQAIVGAFRTVSLARAEVEAGIESLQTRLQKQQQKFWVSCHTLPSKHPWWKVRKGVDIRNKRFPSPLQRIAERLQAVGLGKLETIEPFSLAPWQEAIEACIPDREEAQKWTAAPHEVKVLTDASYRNSNAGVGLYCPIENKGNVFTRDKWVIALGQSEGLTATHVEIMAVQQALLRISDLWCTQTIRRLGVAASILTYVVISDSQAAIRIVSTPGRQSGQAKAREINRLAHEIRERGGPRVRIRWVPAHSKIVGNEIANKLAREATTGPQQLRDELTLPSALKKAHSLTAPTKLKKTDNIDCALPGTHVRTLYDNLVYQKAAVLCQLRTGMCRLKGYLARIGAVETDKCDCQRAPPETVRHFLFECPQWANHRHLLQDVADSRWGDLSYYLGGRSIQRRSSGEPRDGPAKSWKPDLTVVRRTIDFAIATGRLT